MLPMDRCSPSTHSPRRIRTRCWNAIRLGLVMLTGSAAVVPLSVGLALGAVAFVFGRKLYYEELRKPEGR